ncbi:MFS transporter [Paraburkholderia megapolitana]|uniref:MFS transporter n=1 Tax=Paraburkholderia megapolitana TaxID=420953 RepID=UPI001478AD8F|nr:MFS transporter [Paraburkholderia megapolitana]
MEDDDVAYAAVTEIANAPDGAHELETAFRKNVWRLLPLLLVSLLFVSLDRINVAYAKLQMDQELGFGEAVYGLGAGIFFISYSLLDVPSNLILARIGARGWLGRILITVGVLSACTAFVSSVGQFYLVRFLLGAAEAGFFPGVLYYLTQWFPGRQRARAIAWLYIAFPLSGVVGGFLSGHAIASLHNFLGLSGWRWMFVAEGLPTAILGAACLFLLPGSDIAGAAWLTLKERTGLAELLAQEQASKPQRSLLKALGEPATWLLGLIMFCISFTTIGLSLFIPTIIRETGLTSSASIGNLSALPFVCGSLAMILLAQSNDRTRRRRLHTAIPALVGGIALIVVALNPGDLAPTIVALTVAVGGSMGALPMFWTLPPARYGGMASAGSLALINGLGNLSGFVGPYATGWIRSVSTQHNIAVYLMAGRRTRIDSYSWSSWSDMTGSDGRSS